MNGNKIYFLIPILCLSTLFLGCSYNNNNSSENASSTNNINIGKLSNYEKNLRSQKIITDTFRYAAGGNNIVNLNSNKNHLGKVRDYFDRDFLIKEASDYLSQVFYNFETLILSGNSNYDFSSATFLTEIDDLMNGKISKYERMYYYENHPNVVEYKSYFENQNISQTHCFISNDPENRYMAEFKVQEFYKANTIPLRYTIRDLTKEATYSFEGEANKSWEKDIDKEIERLKKEDTKAYEALEMLKENYKSKSINDIDFDHPSKIISEFPSPYHYLKDIAHMHMHINWEIPYSIANNENLDGIQNIIRDGEKLKSFRDFSSSYYLIPSSISEIEKIGGNNTLASDKMLYIPSSVSKIQVGAFSEFDFEVVFIDQEENEEMKNLITSENEGVEIFFKSEFHLQEGVPVPNSLHPINTK